jgi:hypothetical protein
VKSAGVAAVALEARKAVATVQNKEAHAPVGPLVVCGALAEQLARELRVGAAPGAVVVRELDVAGERSGREADAFRDLRATGGRASGFRSCAEGAEAVIRVLAGDPGDVEDALVREADRLGTPVVFVQLWPQADWGALFVLSPFVIECRAGEGFPVPAIAETVVRAVEHPEALAARIPVLKEPVESSVVRSAIARAALIGATGARKGPTRPLITLEQLRMLSSLRAADHPDAGSEIPAPALAAATVAAGFALRALARVAGRSLPAPLVNAAVAAGGTWALAKALETLQARGQSSS